MKKILKKFRSGEKGFTLIELLVVIAILGVLAAVAGVLVILHVLYCVIAGQAVPGWATMTILISIFGSLNLMGLGIVGEYLGRIFEEAKNRPLYWLQDDTASHADNPYRETHDHL